MVPVQTCGPVTSRLPFGPTYTSPLTPPESPVTSRFPPPNWSTAAVWIVTVEVQLVESLPLLTVSETGNVPAPLNRTVGMTPVAVPPMNGPVQVYVRGLPSGSEEPAPLSVTLVRGPAQVAPYGPPALQRNHPTLIRPETGNDCESSIVWAACTVPSSRSAKLVVGDESLAGAAGAS